MRFDAEAAQFSQAATTPFAFNDERHGIALREVLDPVMLCSNHGQYFSSLVMNRDFAVSGKPAAVLKNGFGEDVHGVPVKWRAYQFAAAMQDRMVVMTDLPGHGTSSKVTPPQRAEIGRTATMGLMARAQLEGLRARFADVKQLAAIGGVSLGGLIALEALGVNAQHDLGFEPQRYIGIEAAGFDRRFVGGLLGGFYLAELFKGGRYGDSVTAAARLHVGFAAFERQLKAAGYTGRGHDPARIFKEDKGIMARMAWHGVLNNGRSFERLRARLDDDPKLSAHMVNGGRSSVVRWRKIQELVTETVEAYPGRVHWHLWPDDSHGMGLNAQQPRLAAYARRAILL